MKYKCLTLTMNNLQLKNINTNIMTTTIINTNTSNMTLKPSFENWNSKDLDHYCNIERDNITPYLIINGLYHYIKDAIQSTTNITWDHVIDDMKLIEYSDVDELLVNMSKCKSKCKCKCKFTIKDILQEKIINWFDLFELEYEGGDSGSEGKSPLNDFLTLKEKKILKLRETTKNNKRIRDLLFVKYIIDNVLDKLRNSYLSEYVFVNPLTQLT